MAMDSTAPAPPGRAPRRSQLAAARAGPQARPRSFSQSTEFIMSFSAPGPRPADAPGRCSLDLGFKIKNGIQNFQQHVAARFREPSASCTFPSHGRWLPVSSVVSSRPLAQMIIGIRCRRSSRNPRKDTTNHVSKCRVSGRESIFDLRITLQPRAAHPIPKLIKGQARPSETTAARRTHARARPAHQEKEPPQ